MSDMSMVKRRQENLWMLGRAYKLAYENATQTRALLIEALSAQQRLTYEYVRVEKEVFSWMLADGLSVSQSAACDLLRGLHELGLLERCATRDLSGYAYVVTGG